jgi:hypothetical protein
VDATSNRVVRESANIVSQIAPLVAEGKDVLSETDAGAVHSALTKAEAATATLRP